MKTYQVNGDTYKAKDAENLLRQMWDKAQAGVSFHEWALGLAARARIQTGQPFRDDRYEHLVADLIAAGLVREVGDGAE